MIITTLTSTMLYAACSLSSIMCIRILYDIYAQHMAPHHIYPWTCFDLHVSVCVGMCIVEYVFCCQQFLYRIFNVVFIYYYIHDYCLAFRGAKYGSKEDHCFHVLCYFNYFPFLMELIAFQIEAVGDYMAL